jgi:hypothetical protein
MAAFALLERLSPKDSHVRSILPIGMVNIAHHPIRDRHREITPHEINSHSALTRFDTKIICRFIADF